MKVDDSADNALKQIKDKNYVQGFKGKVADRQEVKEVVLVGISYDKFSKKHTCRIEMEYVYV